MKKENNENDDASEQQTKENTEPQMGFGLVFADINACMDEFVEELGAFEDLVEELDEAKTEADGEDGDPGNGFAVHFCELLRKLVQFHVETAFFGDVGRGWQ